MEIGHYLRARPRLTALALLLPLLAALLAFVVLQNRPAGWTATATVAVPGSAADSASRVGIYVADFSQLATSATVVSDVAAKTREPRGDVKAGLEVARIGQSSLFTVAYTGDARDRVEPVVREAIAATFGRLTSAAGATSTLDAATKAYNDALAARQQYQDQIGTLQPDRDYADLSSRIRSLQTNITFSGPATIEQLKRDRDALVPEIRQMQLLDQAVADTASRRADAQRSAASANSDVAEASSPSTVRDLTVVEGSKATQLVQGVGVAAVAGLLAGLALLVLPDVLRRRTDDPDSAPHDGARRRLDERLREDGRRDEGLPEDERRVEAHPATPFTRGGGGQVAPGRRRATVSRSRDVS